VLSPPICAETLIDTIKKNMEIKDASRILNTFFQ
jgi:hypothetical protein